MLWLWLIESSLGSLAVGILVPYNDPELTAAYADGLPGAAASPYVASMNRLRIKVLPHIVNAMVLTSALSAGNSYVYCASRSLYGLALEGKAPKFMTKCTKNGVPIYCVTATLLIALLAFLQVSNNAAVVLQWFVNLVSRPPMLPFRPGCLQTFHRSPPHSSSISVSCASRTCTSRRLLLPKASPVIAYLISLSGNRMAHGMPLSHASL